MQKRNYQTWLIVVIACVVVLATVSGCSSDNSTNDPANTPTEDSPALPLHYYVVSEANAEGAIPIGCDQFAVPQDSGDTFTDEPLRDVRNGLEALFAAEPADFSNLWMGASITELSLPPGGLRLQIVGGYTPTGVCADAAAEAQILLVVFADSSVEEAYITLDGRNMKQRFDGSGLVEASETYTRADLPTAP